MQVRIPSSKTHIISSKAVCSSTRLLPWYRNFFFFFSSCLRLPFTLAFSAVVSVDLTQRLYYNRPLELFPNLSTLHISPSCVLIPSVGIQTSASMTTLSLWITTNLHRGWQLSAWPVGCQVRYRVQRTSGSCARVDAVPGRRSLPRDFSTRPSIILIQSVLEQ